MGFSTVLVVSFVHVLFSDVAADECGTKFVDPGSSTVLARIVFQGSVNQMTVSSTNTGIHRANVSISRIYKGEDILTEMGINSRDGVMVDRFALQENRDACIASAEAVNGADNLMFFCRPSSSRGVLQLTAIPLPAGAEVTETVAGSLCENCVRAPEIKRVKCKHCARAPAIKRVRSRRVRMGKRGRLRCVAFGFPLPTFSWTKDGIPVVSGSGGITVDSQRTVSVLTVNAVSSAHAGQYVCSAKNGVGSADKSANLNVIQDGNEDEIHSGHTVITASDRQLCSSQNLCLNGGTCYFSPSLDLRVCTCTPGYDGVRCEVPKDIPPNNITPKPRIEANTTSSDISEPSSTLIQADSTKPLFRFDTFSSIGGTQNLSTSTVAAPTSTVAVPTLVATTHTTTPAAETQTPSVTSTHQSTRGSSTATHVRRKPKRGKSKKFRKTIRQHQTETRSHPAEGRNYPNVDDDALKLLRSRLADGTINASECRDERQCQNGGSCHFIDAFSVNICQCTQGFSGRYCENAES